MLNIEYIIANPSGNVTIIVLTPVEKKWHSTVAGALLQHETEAEQAGFLTMKQDGVIRLDMMGGEFCGNASRAAAAYAVMQENCGEGSYSVSCSGCEQLLHAQVQRREEGGYEAYIDMPLPESIDAVILDMDGMPSRFYRVVLPGMVHFIHWVDDMEQVSKEAFWDAVYSYAKDEDYDAFGLILFDPRKLCMVPAVYVKGTQTMYWENSCGSGSAAVAATLAVLGKKDVACRISQPGGTISIAAQTENEVLTHVYIGGTVTCSERRYADISVPE